MSPLDVIGRGGGTVAAYNGAFASEADVPDRQVALLGEQLFVAGQGADDGAEVRLLAGDRLDVEGQAGQVVAEAAEVAVAEGLEHADEAVGDRLLRARFGVGVDPLLGGLLTALRAQVRSSHFRALTTLPAMAQAWRAGSRRPLAIGPRGAAPSGDRRRCGLAVATEDSVGRAGVEAGGGQAQLEIAHGGAAGSALQGGVAPRGSQLEAGVLEIKIEAEDLDRRSTPYPSPCLCPRARTSGWGQCSPSKGFDGPGNVVGKSDYSPDIYPDISSAYLG
jgi:hypothetical protein